MAYLPLSKFYTARANPIIPRLSLHFCYLIQDPIHSATQISNPKSETSNAAEEAALDQPKPKRSSEFLEVNIQT